MTPNEVLENLITAMAMIINGCYNGSDREAVVAILCDHLLRATADAPYGKKATR